MPENKPPTSHAVRPPVHLQPALFTMEGLIYYLPPSAALALVARITQLAGEIGGWKWPVGVLEGAHTASSPVPVHGGYTGTGTCFQLAPLC